MRTRRPLLGAGFAALLLSAPAHAAVEGMKGPVPVSSTSTIYGAASVPEATPSFDLAAHGYVEEEYFVRGKADAFAHEPSGQLATMAKDVPYVTRIIVRRPRDARAFSGFVHFEPLHPSQGGNSHWLATADYIMAKGDIYVAAALGDDPPTRATSAKGPVPVAQSQITKWFDPVRYAELNWPEEDGIRFQVMADIGKYLRSNSADNPLRGLKVRRMIVGGWSFTGSVQRTFINEGFHDRARLPDGKPVFDGYLVGISSRWNGGGYVPLNTHEENPAPADPRRKLRSIDVPVIEFLSEFEFATGPGPQEPDRDGINGGHRVYQIGGTIHSASMLDGNPPREKRPNYVQLAAKGYPVTATGGEEAFGTCPLPISDVPHGAVIRAVLDDLKQWADTGVTPPRADDLVRAPDGTIARDAQGNPLGGIRVAEFEAPVASYGLYTGTDKPACVAKTGRPIFLRQDLDPASLAKLYAGKADWLARYDAAIDRMVAGRWLLSVDAATLKAKARTRADSLFTH